MLPHVMQRCLIGAVVVAVACGSDKRAEPTPAPVPEVPAGAAVYYDDEQVATVSAADLAERTWLADVVEEEYRDQPAWVTVELAVAGGATVSVALADCRPHDPALYRGPDGALAFACIPDEDGAPRQSVVTGVTTVRIATAPAGSELDRVGGIAVGVGGKTAARVPASKIRTLPVHRKGSRGETGKPKVRGRSLRALVGLVTNPDEVTSVIVRGEGESHTFSADDLARDDGEHILFRRDRRGNLIVRWLMDTGQRGQFRNVELVEVALREP